MNARTRDIFRFGKTGNGTTGEKRAPSDGRAAGHIRWFLRLALAVFLLQAAGTAAAQTGGTLDSRWLPWIGTWKLASSTVNAVAAGPGEGRLEVVPAPDGKSVALRAFQDDAALFEDTIAADGSVHQLTGQDCTGWYRYSWSDTGKRLLFESESRCPGTAPRTISGLSLISARQEWVDIQLLQSAGERVITIRRYVPSEGGAVTAGGVSPAAVHGMRADAGARLSIDEVIELSAKVASEVLEAAVLQIREPFGIHSKSLRRLADAGVPDPVIDLMVALSFPEAFVIERDTVSLAQQTESGLSDSRDAYRGSPGYATYYSIYDPYFPWYWTPSTYSLYWNSGWSTWPGVYYYYPVNGGSPGEGPGGGYPKDSGRLVSGRGYTNIYPRDGRRSARPRGEGVIVAPGGARSGATYPPSAPPAPSGSVAAPASGGSSGASSSGSGSSSGGGTSSGGSSPSVSPGGYSIGTGGRGQAQPR